MSRMLLHTYAALVAPPPRAGRDERGDVPGWVLITVMTAGLVGALWQFAGPELKSLLADALRQVSG